MKAAARPVTEAPVEPAGEALAARLLGQAYDTLDGRTRTVARHVALRQRFVQPLAPAGDELPTLAQRAADTVARFGGSWTFVGLFAATMLAWVAINTALLISRGRTFDPYPYILLNLFLSMLAAIQAPIILMSQNRHAERDRRHAEHDYEVNLKAELEIMLLHEKLDALRQTQWADLIAMQQAQLALLARLSPATTADPP